MIVRHFPVTPAQLERETERMARRQCVLADMREVLACAVCAVAGALTVLLVQFIWSI